MVHSDHGGQERLPTSDSAGVFGDVLLAVLDDDLHQFPDAVVAVLNVSSSSAS
jgi:hypothetical protein